MELQIPFPAIKQIPQISHLDHLLMIGSCFTDKISERLRNHKFKVTTNPFGILYSPLSMARCLKTGLHQDLVREKDLFEQDGIWHSWDFHSSFSGINPTEVLTKMNESITEANRSLSKVNWLILSLGTAFQYYFIGSENREEVPVANCHKVPATRFKKILTPINVLFDALNTIINEIRVINPNLKILLTVSPVRHIRDGIIENNQSKARLLEVSHQLEKSVSNLYYFPAYEILIDILRDYRFYERDLVHPNELAVDFIWNYFQQQFFSSDTKQINQSIQRIIQVCHHRPQFPETAAYQKLILKTIQQINQLEKSRPELDFQAEYDLLKTNLKADL